MIRKERVVMTSLELLHQIIEELEEYDIELKGASQKETRSFEEKVLSSMKAKLPEEYAALLAEVNGFAHNDVHFLGIDDTPTLGGLGFFEQNYVFETLHPYDDHFMVFAVSPFWVYALHVESGAYQAIDRKTWKSDCEFESFEDMISYPFREALNLLDLEEESVR